MYQIISSPWFSFELHDIDILALAIWLCASVIIYRGIMLWRSGPLAPRTRFDMFVATVTVLWFSYYVKRPQTLNLWSNAFLFAFLLPACSMFVVSAACGADFSRVQLLPHLHRSS